MKYFFDIESGKFFDITAEGDNVELNYRFAEVLADKDYSDSYNKLADGVFYQVSPSQLKVGKVPVDIIRPETVSLLTQANLDLEDFGKGQTQGQLDATITGTRAYMSKMRNVSWSFLVGYEYGILLECYVKQNR